MSNLPEVVEPFRITLSLVERPLGQMVINVSENVKPKPTIYPIYQGNRTISTTLYFKIINTMSGSNLWHKKEMLNGGTYYQTTLEWSGGQLFTPSEEESKDDGA